MKRKIIELHYNYKPAVSDGREIFGEDWETVKHGEKNVLFIEEHLPEHQGDKLYYDIFYNNNTMIRIFNPCLVKYQL